MVNDVAIGFVCFRIDGVGFRRFRVCRRFCLNWDSWDWRGILGISVLFVGGLRWGSPSGPAPAVDGCLGERGCEDMILGFDGR